MSRKHIRGSSLLLTGRLLSILVKFVAQVLIVRHLSTGDYGAWTYALAAALFFRGFSTLGLNNSLPRFLAIYLERKEYDRFFGTIAFILGTLLTASFAVVLAFYLLPEQLASLAGQGTEAIHLLFIVIFLIPLEALDDFLTGVLATFSKSRTVFVRRYIIAPSLLLGAGILLVAFQADVRFLAFAYVTATSVGVLYYLWSVARVLQREGLFKHLRQGVSVPATEIASYTAPLAAADWAGTLLVTIGPLMLGYYADLDAVAIFQVVVPMVALAEVVTRTFALLYKPTASRLFARGDLPELQALYWRTATWVAVLGFPAFALTFALAQPLVVFSFGARYEASAPILSLLVLAYFLGSAMGPNRLTLMVVGRVGWVAVINVVSAVAALGFHGLLVPRYGALGAGAATAVSVVLLVVLNHLVLGRLVGIRTFEPQYLRAYLAILVSVVFLMALRMIGTEGVVPLGTAAGLTTIAVFLAARECLAISRTFPELGRFRLIRTLLG